MKEADLTQSRKDAKKTLEEKPHDKRRERGNPSRLAEGTSPPAGEIQTEDRWI
jgi:hypothetical protein